MQCPESFPLFDANATDEEFDEALEIHIADAVRWLEESANTIGGDSEESLSHQLAGHLSLRKLISATRETNTRGHVDITILVTTTARKRLGEAKIYAGYAYHEKGIQQLVERYSTGRERSGYMFCYVKLPDIKGKMEKLQVDCDGCRPCRQSAASIKHRERWAFETHHTHSSGEDLRVVHFGINLYLAPR